MRGVEGVEGSRSDLRSEPVVSTLFGESTGVKDKDTVRSLSLSGLGVWFTRGSSRVLRG